jgi:drug/metabolite transporter (DMT)-like permease
MDRVFFNPRIFFLLLLGGILEFCGSILIMLAFSEALIAEVNQGAIGAIMPASAVILLIMSFILYKENITFPQAIGIAMVLTSIVMISLSKAHMNELLNEKLYTIHLADNRNPASAQILAIVTACLASVCFAGESLMIRYLASWGVSGEVSGFFYIFFEGIIGSTCLLLWTLTGSGVFNLAPGSIILLLLAGFAQAGGIVLLDYSISIGNAGVCFSISYSNAAIQAVFTFLLFGQDLTFDQMLGIGISLGGACILALSDKLDCFKVRPNMEMEAENNFN